MRNNTDFNIGGLEVARTHGMKQAIRVLEHACRVTTRLASDSTSTTTKTGRLAKELEGYLNRLKRLEDQGRTKEFYRVLQNAQMKLINLACELLCQSTGFSVLGAAVTLGSAVKLIRTARGLSQKGLATKLKVSANYLSLIEGNKRDPSLAFLKRLAAELKVPVAMFFVFQTDGVRGVHTKDLDHLKGLLLQLDHMIVENKRH
jgi:transcriptional regulator with XRE-family HTH domain